MPVNPRLALVVLAGMCAASCAAAPARTEPVTRARAPLTATLTTPTDIDLRWPATSPGAAGHLLEYANAPEGPWTTLQYLAPTQTTYRHPDLIPETPFSYRIREFSGPVSAAVTAGGPASPGSGGPAVSVRAPGSAAAPAALKAVVGADASVRFTWTDRSRDEAGFLVEIREPGAGDFTPIEVTDPDTTTCALSLLPGEHGSSFRVRALFYGPVSPVVTRTTGRD